MVRLRGECFICSRTAPLDSPYPKGRCPQCVTDGRTHPGSFRDVAWWAVVLSIVGATIYGIFGA